MKPMPNSGLIGKVLVPTGTCAGTGNWIAQRMRMRVTWSTGVKIVSFQPFSSGVGASGGPVKKGAGSSFSVG